MELIKMKIGDFSVQINPNTITFNRSIKYVEDKAIGKNRASPTFMNYGAEIITFALILDGTGVVEGSRGIGKSDDVNAKLAAFEKAVFLFDGNKHGPKAVKIEWASLVLEECLIQTYNITYQLFSATGNPIRAKVDLTFQGYTNQEEREKLANKNSPDLTHVKTVRMGDELFLLCNDVYKSPKYFLQVAEKNNIINFRNLNVGEKLLFPPLER